MLFAMSDAPAKGEANRMAGLTPIWIALAVIVIVALSWNTAQFWAEIDRMNATGVYRSELENWSVMRLFLAKVWGKFWWLFGPFILCAFPGAVALYRMVRFDSSNPRW
jgi:hypothetical protein